MLINENGIEREMTEEETNFYLSLLEQTNNQPSLEEQIKEIKTNQLDLAEAITQLYESSVINNG